MRKPKWTPALQGPTSVGCSVCVANLRRQRTFASRAKNLRVRSGLRRIHAIYSLDPLSKDRRDHHLALKCLLSRHRGGFRDGPCLQPRYSPSILCEMSIDRRGARIPPYTPKTPPALNFRAADFASSLPNLHQIFIECDAGRDWLQGLRGATIVSHHF